MSTSEDVSTSDTNHLSLLGGIAIDPGGTTGIAYRMTVESEYHTLAVIEPRDVWGIISSHNWTAIIIEDFNTGGNISKYGLHTVRIIGGVQALAWKMDIPLVIHMPFFRRPWLKQSKDILRLRQHVIHEEDALAHLLAWESEGR